jgi:hypothetical protein
VKNFRHQKKDINEVPLWEPTDIRDHFTEFRFCGELATRSFAPLPNKRKYFRTIYIGLPITNEVKYLSFFSGSWFRASAITTVNKIQQDAPVLKYF